MYACPSASTSIPNATSAWPLSPLKQGRVFELRSARVQLRDVTVGEAEGAALRRRVERFRSGRKSVGARVPDDVRASGRIHRDCGRRSIRLAVRPTEVGRVSQGRAIGCELRDEAVIEVVQRLVERSGRGGEKTPCLPTTNALPSTPTATSDATVLAPCPAEICRVDESGAVGGELRDESVLSGVQRRLERSRRRREVGRVRPARDEAFPPESTATELARSGLLPPMNVA